MQKFLTILRSIGAVLAGYVVLAVLIIVLLMAALTIVPAWGVGISTAYITVNILLSIFSSACGGWVAAWLAPGQRFQHGLALGLVTLGLGIIYAMNPQAEAGMPQPPEWYRYLLAALALPSVLGGSLLYMRFKSSTRTTRAAARRQRRSRGGSA